MSQVPKRSPDPGVQTSGHPVTNLHKNLSQVVTICYCLEHPWKAIARRHLDGPLAVDLAGLLGLLATNSRLAR